MRNEYNPDGKDIRFIDSHYKDLGTMRTHHKQPVYPSVATGKTGVSAWCGRSGKDA